MNIQIQDIGPCRKQITIEITEKKVSEAFENVISGYTKYAKIPGFRPGKAPGELVKRRFSKEILKDVKDRLIPEGYQTALSENKLKPVQVIDITETDPKDGEPFGFDVTVDIYPEFKLPDYKSIKVAEQPVEVTDESIDEVVDNMRERTATYEDVSDRASQASDKVMVNYTATVDGEPMDPLVGEHTILAKAENFGVILDPNYSFIPELSESLVGVKEGEKKDVEVNFDSAFIVKEIAGRKAIYSVEVLKIQKKVLPEITDEFLKSVGAESLDAMRTRIREDLTRMKSEQEQRRVQDEVCKELISNTDMNLPESETQRRTADEVYELVQYNSRQGVKQEDIEQNREKIFETAGKNAEEKLKLRYILLKIAEEEKIEVGEQEIDLRIQQLAMQGKKDPAKFKKEIVENNRIGMLRDDILASKALQELMPEPSQEPSAV